MNVLTFSCIRLPSLRLGADLKNLFESDNSFSASKNFCHTVFQNLIKGIWKVGTSYWSNGMRKTMNQSIHLIK